MGTQSYTLFKEIFSLLGLEQFALLALMDKCLRQVFCVMLELHQVPTLVFCHCAGLLHLTL